MSIAIIVMKHDQIYYFLVKGECHSGINYYRVITLALDICSNYMKMLSSNARSTD